MMVDFPINRYKHCHSVGKKMQFYAEECLGWSEEKCQKMFVLGVLHDICYELDGSSYGHDLIAPGVLSGYEYADAISKHSILQEDVSQELALLYYADATVDGEGNWCTYDYRLRDLANRHGEDSDVYRDSCELIEYLREQGFDDTFGI